MAFGKKKEGMYLRPRVRRTTPIVDVALATILGAVTGVYIFKDTIQRWEESEGAFEAAEPAQKPAAPATGAQESAKS